MNSFGLGLVLNFTDKASVGIMGAVGAFQQLNDITDPKRSNLGAIGGVLTSLGGTLTALSAPLTAFIKNMWEGSLAEASFMENTAIALETLLGSAEAAQQHLGAITAFSYETPFEYTPLVGASQALLGMGKSSEESIKTLRMLGDTAGATGRSFGWVQEVLDVMMKVSAEGKISEVRMQQLRTRGVDLTNVMRGMSADDVWLQLEKNMSKNAGMMDKMLNTWSGAVDEFKSKVSIAGDILLGNFIDINEAGEFVMITTGLNRLTASLRKVSAFIEDMAEILAPLGNTVITFIEKVTDGLTLIATKYKNANDNQKKFASTLLQIFIIGSPVAAVLGGILVSLSKLGVTTKLTAAGLFKLMGTILPLITLFSLLYFATRAQDGALKDLRDRFNNTFGNVLTIVGSLYEYFTKGYIPIDKFNDLEKRGLLPIVETVIQLVRHFKAFFGGFITGLKNSSERLANFLNTIFKVGEEGEGLGDKFLKFFQKITEPGMIDTWIEMGEKAGEFLFMLGGIIGAVKTLQGAVKILTNPFGILFVVISALFYLFTNNVGGIRDKFFSLINTVQEFWDKLAENGAIENWKGAFDKIWDAAVNVFDAIGSVGGLIASIFTDLAGDNFFEWLLSEALPAVIGFVADLAGGIAWFVDGMAKLKGMKEVLAFIAGALIAYKGYVLITELWAKKTQILAAAQGILNAVMNANPVGLVVLAVVALISAIILLWNNSEGFRNFIITAWEVIKNVFITTAKIILGVFESIGRVVWIILRGIASAFLTVFQTIGAIVYGAFISICEVIKGPIDVFINTITTIFTNVKTIFTNIIDFIKNVFTGNWKGAWENVKNIFKAIFDTFKAIALTPINAIISIINGAIKGLNKISIKVPDWSPIFPGKEFGFNIPQIPLLNTGGEITKEGTAVVHPAEVVVDSNTTKGLKEFLSDYKRMKSTPQAQAAPKGADSYDNRVYFQAGSIVFQVDKNTSEADIERYAEILMKKIERLQQKKKMATRNTGEKSNMTSRRWETVNG